jgi:mono/diheme cytochrome c family protein
MSTSIGVIIRRLAMVFLAAALLFGVILLFTYDIIKIDWPSNPTEADDASIARGKELFTINCAMCHGATGEGNGPVAAFLINFKPANLTSPLVQSKSDGTIFLTISNGLEGRMPPLNENLTVPERWDVVNYVRTLKANK